jgi:hypothetical protein
VLLKVASEFDVVVEEINILEDPEVHEKYRYDIPVVFLEDAKLFKHRVNEQALRRALSTRLKDKNTETQGHREKKIY